MRGTDKQKTAFHKKKNNPKQWFYRLKILYINKKYKLMY